MVQTLEAHKAHLWQERLHTKPKFNGKTINVGVRNKLLNELICANMNTQTYHIIFMCHHSQVEVQVVRSELLDMASSYDQIIYIGNYVNCAHMEFTLPTII